MTTTGPRTNFTPHLVFGLAFIFFGVVLTLDRLGVIEAARSLQYWPVGLIVIGGALILQALRGDRGGPEGTVNQFPVGPAIWLVILIFVFARPFRADDDTRPTNDRPKLVAVLGGDRRTSVAAPFRGAEMTSVMGGSVLDLRKAIVSPGDEVTIDVFTLMGGTVLRVPNDWIVDLQVTTIMGGAKDERRRSSADIPSSEAAAAPPRVVLKGVTVMGGVVIKS